MLIFYIFAQDFINLIMRRIIVTTLVAAFCCMVAYAGDDSTRTVVKPFLEIEQLPDETVYLPAPPKETELNYINDLCKYQWGKTVRDTERGAQAAKDADHTIGYMLDYFAPAFGMKITEEATPETWKLVSSAIYDGSNSVRRGKKKYMRTRPFVYYNEVTATPADEEILRPTGSYPSGHTSRGWMCALVLVELNPDRQNEILKAGYEYGQSRVIVGVHYQSDVDAARLASSAAFARLHADKNFCHQLKKARKELEKTMNVNSNNKRK